MHGSGMHGGVCARKAVYPEKPRNHDGNSQYTDAPCGRYHYSAQLTPAAAENDRFDPGPDPALLRLDAADGHLDHVWILPDASERD